MQANGVSFSGDFPNEYNTGLIDYVGPLESLNGIEVVMARCMDVVHPYKKM